MVKFQIFKDFKCLQQFDFNHSLKSHCISLLPSGMLCLRQLLSDDMSCFLFFFNKVCGVIETFFLNICKDMEMKAGL